METITLQGPGKNALGTELLRFLGERLRSAGGAPILLTGSADAFSAGLNLKEVASLDPPRMRAFLGLLEEIVVSLYLYPGPTVALINGHAIAGGCVLALCCDHRVSSDDPKIRIGLNEGALGLRFPPRILEIVRRRVPARAHEEVVLGAQLFNPSEAQRVGLVDVVAGDPAAVAAQDLLRLAALPAAAYAANKGDLRGTSAGDLCPEPTWTKRTEEMLPVWNSPALKEKLLAVLQRPPKG